jgi:transcriptional regulator with XRE-family HTH domain
VSRDTHATDYGDILRKRRKALGLSLRAVSEASGVDHGNISRIERGELGLSLTTLEKLVPALGYHSLAEFFLRHEDRRSWVEKMVWNDYLRRGDRNRVRMRSAREVFLQPSPRESAN